MAGHANQLNGCHVIGRGQLRDTQHYAQGHQDPARPIESKQEITLLNRIVLCLLPLLLTACSSMFPPRDRATENRINQELNKAAATKSAASGTTAPATTSNETFSELIRPSVDSVIPRSALGKQESRFDLTVNDAPIGEVLAGLVSGTDYSVLLRPVTAEGGTKKDERRISLNLKNVTLFEAFDSIREIYDYDYTVNGKRILVQPADVQTKIYKVNYVLGQRRGVSDLQVIAGASVGSTTSSTSTSSTTSNYGSTQASALSTSVRSDIWTEAEDAIRTVLGCAIPKAAAAARAGTSSTSGNASRADVSYSGEAQPGERLRGAEGCPENRAITINQMSGTILARGMPKELRMIEQLLESMQLTISRQVIIEAKIIDVELNSDSQQGINWSAFRNGLTRFSVGASAGSINVNQPGAGGSIPSGTTLGTLLNSTTLNNLAPNSFAAGMSVAIQASNFAALINFLESQGRVHVLSSPRIATMNNQKAVIKVGDEEPFVTNITGGSVTVPASGSTVTTQPNLTYQPFFSGIALDVTPQIDAEDNITLHVNSLVNTVEEKNKTVLLNSTGSTTTAAFAVNKINQTDSVVKAKDGEVIVIGGLMKESAADDRGGVPGIRDVPGVGGLFNRGAQAAVKRELVIMLKPTIVKDSSAWAKDISATGERINEMNATPARSRLQ